MIPEKHDKAWHGLNKPKHVNGNHTGSSTATPEATSFKRPELHYEAGNKVEKARDSKGALDRKNIKTGSQRVLEQEKDFIQTGNAEETTLSNSDDILIATIVITVLILAGIILWNFKTRATRHMVNKHRNSFLDNNASTDEEETEILTGGDYFRMEPEARTPIVDVRHVIRINSRNSTVGYQSVPAVDV